MNDTDLPAQGNNDVELVDLDAVEAANQFVPGWTKRRVLAWQRELTRGRLRLISAAALCALAIIILASAGGWLVNLAAIFPSASRSVSGHVPQTVPHVRVARALLPQQQGLVCIADAAWSPDSRTIAVIGYQGACVSDGATNGAGSLIVYDAPSGKLLAHVSTDNLVFAAFHRQFPRVHTRPIPEYEKLLWSPDGSHLALSFLISFTKVTPNGIQITPAYTGILLYDQGNTQVFLHPQTDGFAFTEWDTLRGQPVHVEPGNSPFMANPLAAAYRWGSDGALLPVDTSQRALAPIGNPASGNIFTLWQPGIIQIDPPYEGAGSQQKAIYLFNTLFAAWSPDGRYLATIFVFARLARPGQSRAGLPASFAGIGLPASTLNMRPGDAALQHALTLITGPLVASNLILLSWRLDGRALAVYNASTTELDILDCASGHQTTSLLLSTTVPPGALSGSYLLSWSPNGHRLLMFDPDVGELLTWDMP